MLPGTEEALRNSDTTKVEVISLHQKEMDLIKALRHSWRFGRVTILMRDGLPYRLERVTEFIDLADRNRYPQEGDA